MPQKKSNNRKSSTRGTRRGKKSTTSSSRGGMRGRTATGKFARGGNKSGSMTTRSKKQGTTRRGRRGSFDKENEGREAA